MGCFRRLFLWRVSQEGSTPVTGTATDTAGNQATATVIVKIDRTPPGATINLTDGATTSATTIVVASQVSDALSAGVAVTCNGVPATVSNGNAQCDVPLQPGRNAVIVHALDAAGNGTSAGVNVARTGLASSIKVSPMERTLLVGLQHQFSVVDDYGVKLSATAWTSTDENVVTVDAEGIVTPVTAGTATISATKDGLSSDATVTVLEGATLPHGTVRWSVATENAIMRAPIYSHRVADDVPEMFSIERDDATGRIFTVRGLTSTGEQLWKATSPGEPIAGDSFGGLIATLKNAAGDSVGLARFGGPAGSLPWRHESPGEIYFGAQNAEGTIFAIEVLRTPRPNGSTFRDGFVIALDGATGRVTFRRAIPRQITFERECTPNSAVYEPGGASRAVIGADGAGFVVVLSSRFTELCNGDVDLDRELTLLRISSDGTTASSQSLVQHRYTGPYWAVACTLPSPSVEEILPDSRAGLIVTWRQNLPLGCSPLEKRVARVTADGTVTLFALPSYNWAVQATGDGVAYIGESGQTTNAVDVETWAPKWTIDPQFALPLMATEDGGIVTHYEYGGIMRTVDGAGTTTETPNMYASALTPSRIEFGAWYGIAPSFRSLVELQGPQLEGSGFQFLQGQMGLGAVVGNTRRQNAAQLRPKTGIFVKGHFVFLYHFHVSIRIVPTNQPYWRARRPDLFQHSNGRHWYATIGAAETGGSALDLCDGVLKSDTNRPTDVDPRARHREPLQISPNQEDQLIQRLLDLDSNYRDNLPYACFPGPDPDPAYNSNSYAAGLLNAADIPLPSFPFDFHHSYPGWKKPVPPVNFAPTGP